MIWFINLRVGFVICWVVTIFIMLKITVITQMICAVYGVIVVVSIKLVWSYCVSVDIIQPIYCCFILITLSPYLICKSFITYPLIAINN